MGKIDQRIALLVWFLCASSCVYSQYNIGFEHSTSIGIIEQSELRLATVGGFTNPQFSEIDLNNDQLADLFVFDRANDTWRTFIYNGTEQRYDYAPSFESIFPSSLNELVLLRDMDCDDDQDIIAYNNGKFAVYANDGSIPPSFDLVTDAIQTDYGSLVTAAFIIPGDMPAILDVDDDGDIDILTFGNGDSENSIVWHENLSMDEYGTCDSLEFKVNTQCWGGFEEPPNSSTLEAIACRPEITPPNPYIASRHHPGSTVLLTDTDGDNDMDVVLGDIQTKTLVYAPNEGDATSPNIDVSQQTTQFPSAANPANMQYMVAGYEIDHNHDGKMDLVISTNNNIDSSCNDGHTWLYTNNANVGATYALETKSFLLEDMLDLGTGAIPRTLDVNGDGLLDLVIATDFLRTPTISRGSRLYYFENTGTSTNPSFTLQNADFAGISVYGFQAAHHAFGDLDGDGDQDMLIGDADGFLHYFQNTPSGNMASFTLVAPNYMGINSIGQNAAPEIADINADGLLDLLVGERIGTIAYFENTGSTTVAEFSSAPTISKLGKIDVSFFCCNGFAAPRYIDDAAFGDEPYIFIGSSEKRIDVYPIGANLNDSFAIADSIVILADRITPVFEDFDADGIMDLLIGTGEGGVKYFQRDANYPVGITRPLANFQDMVSLYPNPSSTEFTIAFNTPFSGTISVFNALGNLIQLNSVQAVKTQSINHNWSPGVYFIHCKNAHTSQILRLVVQ